MLFRSCFEDWGSDAHPDLKAVFNDAFAVGKEGKIAVDRVLRLRRMDIKDERWKRAMEAINASIQVVQSRRYIRVHRRANADAKWEQVKLDLSSV